jgi:hypothetical protein
MKAHGEVDVWLHAFLRLALDGELRTSTALPQGNSSLYPLHRRLGGLQSVSGRFWEDKSFKRYERFWEETSFKRYGRFWEEKYSRFF